MTDEFWLKTSNNEVYSTHKKYGNQETNFESSYSTPHEVFRNNTTAVEVIVKQVKNKNNRMEPRIYNLEEINERLCEDVENLKRELGKANKNLEDTKNCFRQVMFELGKQLEAANQRDLKRQTKYLVQQLEKEKLKAVLESKSNLVRKLRKELVNVKRIIKIFIKGIQSVPFSETVHTASECAGFESDMKINIPKTSIANTFDANEVTFETTKSSKV